MSNEISYLLNNTGPILQLSGSDVTRHPKLNIGFGLTLSEEANVPRWTMKLSDDFLNSVNYNPNTYISKSIGIFPSYISSSAGVPFWQANNNVAFLTQIVTSSTNNCFIKTVEFPDNVQVTEFSASVYIPTGHSSVPSTTPYYSIREVAYDGTLTNMATISVAAGTVGAYEAHTSIFSAVNFHPRSDRRYEIYFVGEAGPSSIIGMKVYGFKAVWLPASRSY
jgi:hypothetical protein